MEIKCHTKLVKQESGRPIPCKAGSFGVICFNKPITLRDDVMTSVMYLDFNSKTFVKEGGKERKKNISQMVRGN